MIAPLIKEINAESEDYFDNFRLKCMKYSIRNNTCELFFNYRKKEGQDDYRRIEDVAKIVLPENVRYRFNYARVMDETESVVQFLRNVLFEQFQIKVTADAIAVEHHTMIISLASVDYCACVDTSAGKEIEASLDTEYCRTFVVRFAELKDNVDASVVAEALYQEMRSNSAPTEDTVKRCIQPYNIEKYIGDIVSNDAMYISDVKPDPDAKITLCGKLTNMQVQERLSTKTGKNFTIFRATLTDYTGSIACYSFVSLANMKKYAELEPSAPVLILGTVDKAYKSTELELKVSHLSYCELPSDFHEEVYKRPAPQKYSLLLPVPFETETQSTLFSSTEERVSPYLVGKTFVIFDTETTGVNMHEDRIIEIACVKMVDGKLTEHMVSYVNPAKHIPEGATKVNHITDDMVADAPKLAQIVGDIYKFCSGCTLVGHNVTFDINMLNNTSRETHFYFENNYEDTMRIAQRKVSNARNYTLGNLLKGFDIINKNAHSALADTIATAELFLKLLAL